MTEVTGGTPSGPPANPEAAAKKRELAERTLGEILQRLPALAKLDLKDAADGGISVAIELEGEFPGLTAGKRSHVLESLQFLLNKIVNKPGEERRWVSLGIGAHPEPRGPKPQRAQPQPAAAEATGPAAQPARAPAAPPASRREARAPGRPVDHDERSLEVAPDEALSRAAVELARKSASLGRFYALVSLKPDDRSRILKAVEGVGGVRVSAEGEGRNRRVVFTPDKPVLLPKRTIPDYGEDDE